MFKLETIRKKEEDIVMSSYVAVSSPCTGQTGDESVLVSRSVSVITSSLVEPSRAEASTASYIATLLTLAFTKSISEKSPFQPEGTLSRLPMQLQLGAV